MGYKGILSRREMVRRVWDLDNQYRRLRTLSRKQYLFELNETIKVPIYLDDPREIVIHCLERLELGVDKCDDWIYEGLLRCYGVDPEKISKGNF
jgi:hypothetical protein